MQIHHPTREKAPASGKQKGLGVSRVQCAKSNLPAPAISAYKPGTASSAAALREK